MNRRKLFSRLMDRKSNLFMPGLILAKLLTMTPLLLAVFVIRNIYQVGTAEFSTAWWITFILIAPLYVWLGMEKLIPWTMVIEDFLWKVTQPKKVKKFYDTCNVSR